MNVALFEVTDRTRPKIEGHIYLSGDQVELDMRKVNDRLIADQLIESGTIKRVGPDKREKGKADGTDR